MKILHLIQLTANSIDCQMFCLRHGVEYKIISLTFNLEIKMDRNLLSLMLVIKCRPESHLLQTIYYHEFTVL